MRNGISLLLAALLSLAGSIAHATAVGRTVGQYTLTPTGAAQYSIPIWAPPGPHGVQPHIALVYNSQQGNGYVGVGWGLSGLSSIYRCDLTVAQDGQAVAVALATSDGYCMDGQRLRLTAGTYGVASSTYQTEIANFVNVTAEGVAGNGPQYWTATDRNGWKYTYGGGANGEVLASGSSTAVSWQLSEVTDPNGNTMTIAYSLSNAAGVVVPSVISWVPSSHGSSTYNYTMTFNYGTGGSVHGYVGGTPFNNTNILSSIAIASQGTAVMTYYLTYSNTTTATDRYLLKEVQQCAGTGTSNCLMPTTVGWQAGATGLGTGTALSGTVGSPFNTANDLNGDGINDLVMVTSTGAMVVAFGSSTGYGTPKSLPAGTNGSFGDIDGSGVEGFLVNVSGTWWYYKWNGSAFAGTTTGITVATAASPVLADVDGDGRADFIYTDSSGYVHVRLSTSTAGTVSFPTDINSMVGIAGFSVYAQVGGSNRVLHFWGGAQADLLGVQKTCATYDAKGICTSYQYIYDTLHFTGSTFISGAIPSQVIDFGDYNDDGCTDIVTATQLLLSDCNGAAPTPIAFPSGVTPIGGIDWNGDGRRDLLVAQSSGYLGVVLSTGTGLSSTVTNTSYPISFSTNGYITAPNSNGDGQDGLIESNSAGTSVTYYPHASPGAPPDLATSITDGYGNSVNPMYTPLSRDEVQYSDATYPYLNYIGPMYVVLQTFFSDPSQLPGATWVDDYQYYGPWANLQGRGFQGFYGIRSYDTRNDTAHFSYYGRLFPYAGMLEEEILANSLTPTFNMRDWTGTPANIELSSTTHQQRYFPYFSNVLSHASEVNGPENSDLITTQSTNYTYDNYGNATTIATTVTDEDPGSPYNGATWTTTTTNTTDISANPTADLAAWCLGMLDETQIAYSSSVAGSTSVTRTQVFTPDTPSACRIKQVVTEPTANSGLYKVTEALTFDSFGNVATDTITGANMPSSPASRVTSMNWGTTGQFLTTKSIPIGTVASPATATTSWTYSSAQSLGLGVPDSVKDPNNLITSWVYDGFGRKMKETRPDGTSTKWVWSLCTTYCGWSNSEYQIAQTAYQVNGTTAIRTDTTSYDPVDRATQVAGPTVTGATATTQTLYNSLGLKIQQSMPFLSGTPYVATETYDVLNRPITVSRPISSTNSTLQTTSYAYAGRKTTITDPLGNTKTLVSDVNGKLRKTTDALGYTVTRAYDAASTLNGITDSVGNTLLSGVTIAYGIKPFVTASTDADRGAWTYTVDSLGERTGWRDANGQSFSMTFDALSRPITRTENDLFSEWNYGTTVPSVGKLIAECAQTSAVSNACNTGTWLVSGA